MNGMKDTLTPVVIMTQSGLALTVCAALVMAAFLQEILHATIQTMDSVTVSATNVTGMPQTHLDVVYMTLKTL